METDAPEFNLAELEGKIKEIVNSIQNDASSDPEELEKIKSLIKKNVPFFTRSAFSAYLLRELAKKKEIKRDRKPRAEVKSIQQTQINNESIKKEERVIPEGAKTLYLNIGKMKHLYAKNLSQLLQSELNITREDIYSLRIHDKYSFITMSEENCKKAIEKLNGKEINGRKAEVNFSNR